MPSKAPNYEFEYRYLHFDRAEVLRKARALGATGKPLRTLLVNVTFEGPGGETVRLRNVVTPRSVQSLLTVKTAGKGRFEIEHETEVADANETAALLEMLGCKRLHEMQKFRDVLVVPGLGELDMDSHPGLLPLLEVESPTEAKLNRLVRALGLAPPPAGAPMPRPQELYALHFGVSDKRDKSGDLTFARPSDLERHVTKNKALFARTLASQRAEAHKLLKKHGL